MRSQRSSRAILFIPATSEEKLIKIPSFDSTTCILDLEDSVPPNEK
jgi:citrate lyase beta subunit